MKILAFRIKLFQEDISFAGNTENRQNEFTVGAGCPALDNVKNHPSNISVGNVKKTSVEYRLLTCVTLAAGTSLLTSWGKP